MKNILFLFVTPLFIIIAQGQTNPPSVKIGTQTWMQKNLDVDHYRNGDPIPEVKDSVKWSKLTTGAWCYYKNDPANGKIYGKLYNWYAVNDPRGLAPKGWHIPSDSEWTTLENSLGDSVAGEKMKEAGTNHWESPNTEATNSSGFTGLPGGIHFDDGTFGNVGTNGLWWSATEKNASFAWFRNLYYQDGFILRDANSKRVGYSVRCIKD